MAGDWRLNLVIKQTIVSPAVDCTITVRFAGVETDQVFGWCDDL